MRYNIKTVSISTVTLIILLCALNWAVSPETGKFELSSIDPTNFLEGFVFLLSFGFGLPVWLSVITVLFILFLLWRLLLYVAGRVFK